MAVPHIIATDLSKYGTWNVSGAATGHPATNLSDYDYSLYWASPNNADDQNMTADLGSATGCNAIVIANHNLFTIGGSGVQVVGADDALLTVNPVVISTLSLSNNNDIYLPFGTVTKRYFGLLFGTGLGIPPQVGKFFVDNDLAFTTPYNWSFKRANPEYVTSQKTSLSGITRTSQTYAGRMVYELQWTNSLDDTFDTNFKSFVQKVRGMLRPFFFVDVDSSSTVRYLQLAADYVPITGFRTNIHHLESLVMKSQQATF